MMTTRDFIEVTTGGKKFCINVSCIAVVFPEMNTGKALLFMKDTQQYHASFVLDENYEEFVKRLKQYDLL